MMRLYMHMHVYVHLSVSIYVYVNMYIYVVGPNIKIYLSDISDGFGIEEDIMQRSHTQVHLNIKYIQFYMMNTCENYSHF